MTDRNGTDPVVVVEIDAGALDDACPVCGHRVLHHPRTLLPIGGVASGYYAWAFKLCDGTVVRVLKDGGH